MKRFWLIGLLFMLFACSAKQEKTNVLLITIDDLSCSSVGTYGCKVDNITPNIDHLATQGFLFEKAYTNYSICNPSRSTILTGLYAHNHGSYAENGIHNQVKTITSFLNEKGYFTGIMHKEFHYLPVDAFGWDTIIGTEMLLGSRIPSLFKEFAKGFFQESKKRNKPFMLVANTADPHRPFATRDSEMYPGGSNEPFGISRLYDTTEVENPPYLPEHPIIHEDAALYYTSVHRADEMVGAALEALKESGLMENTLVVLVSDNGSAFPFAKHDCYVESNHIPMIYKWPGKIQSQRDKSHMVTTLDIVPTITELLGYNFPDKTDGRSLVSIINGGKQDGRDAVFSEYEYHTTRAGQCLPYSSRSVQTIDYRYIINFWANDTTSIEPVIRYAPAYEVMVNSTEEGMQERREFYLHRTPEEFYDVKNDPACIHNIIEQPEILEHINKLEALLITEMERNGDPALSAFKQGTPEAFRKYIEQRTEFGKEIRKQQQELKNDRHN